MVVPSVKSGGVWFYKAYGFELMKIRPNLFRSRLSKDRDWQLPQSPPNNLIIFNVASIFVKSERQMTGTR
jgi:hypothetical protein